MIVPKIAQTTEGPAILLTEEAQQLLGISASGQVSLTISDEGEVRVTGLEMSDQARRDRGRAFIERYRETFEALAK